MGLWVFLVLHNNIFFISLLRASSTHGWGCQSAQHGHQIWSWPRRAVLFARGNWCKFEFCMCNPGHKNPLLIQVKVADREVLIHCLHEPRKRKWW
jgi:hypothetical protein